MGWRTNFQSDWIVLSRRSASSVDRYPDGVFINGVFRQTGWINVTKKSVTVVSEARSYTWAALDAAGFEDTITTNTQGDITFSRTHEIQRQNEAGAYKCVKTEMTVTITVT